MRRDLQIGFQQSFLRLKVDTNQTIDRIELRLRSRHLKGLEKDISLLNDPNYLASIFKDKSNNFLTFCNQKTKKRTELIDWKKFRWTVFNQELQLVKRALGHARVTQTAKRLHLRDTLTEQNLKLTQNNLKTVILLVTQ